MEAVMDAADQIANQQDNVIATDWKYLDGIPALLPHNGLSILLDGLSYLCLNRPSDPLN